jgi:hypothetical protein
MLPWFKAMRWTRATSRSHGPAPINRRPSKGLTRHVVHAADHYEIAPGLDPLRTGPNIGLGSDSAVLAAG